MADRLLEFLASEDVQSLAISLGIFLGFLILAKLFSYFLTGVLMRIARRTRTSLDDEILATVRKPIMAVLVVIGLYLALRRLPIRAKYIDLFDGLVYVIGVAFLAYALMRVFHVIFYWYEERLKRRGAEEAAKEFIPLFEKITVIIISVIALIVVLQHFGKDISSILVSVGVGSLAIGLAAKDMLENMISGFLIMIDRPFRVGDRIELSTGQVGDVVDIGMRSTKIATFDHTILIIPNSQIVGSILVNHTFPDKRIKRRIRVGVAYGSDVEKVKRVMIESAESFPEVLNDPPPRVHFIEFGDSALIFQLTFWVEDYRKGFDAQDKINTLINKRFAEEGIEIPFPIRTVILEGKGEEKGGLDRERKKGGEGAAL